MQEINEKIAKVLTFRKPEPKRVGKERLPKAFVPASNDSIIALNAEINKLNQILNRLVAGIREMEAEYDRRVALVERANRLSLQTLQELSNRLGMDIPSLLSGKAQEL